MPYPGYARRGNTNDKSSVNYLNKEIKMKLDMMTQQGRDRSSDKMSAAAMLEKLKELFPDREYILPFESTIKLQQDRNGRTGTGGRCRADFDLPNEVTEFLKRNMHGNINVKPKDLAAEAMEWKSLKINIWTL